MLSVDNTDDDKLKGIDEKVSFIFETRSEEKLYISKSTLILKLPKRRNSLTTSWLNGGYKENLEAVFNHQLNQEDTDALVNGDIYEYMKVTAKKMV